MEKINRIVDAYPGSMHNHTDYSNLRLRDSINTFKGLIDYALELGHKAVAITEHECISNAVKVEKYYTKIKKDNPEFKVIRGNEIYLCRNGLSNENFVKGTDKYYHFILLAKDAIGHKQIRQLSTRAWKRSYVANKMRRVPTYYSDIEEIIGVNRGHVIGSTACLGGALPTQLLIYRETKDENLMAQIHAWINYLVGIFGKENFYFEMQPSNDKDQIYVNQKIIELSEEFGIRYIITTDSHYLKKGDAPIHKAYLNSQNGDREVDAFYATTYMMSTEELESFFSYFTKEQIQSAYDSIYDIIDSCEDYSLLKPLKIPRLPWKEPKTKEIEEFYIEKMPYLKNFIESSYEGDNVLARIIIDKVKENKKFQTQRAYDEINDNLKYTWISSEVNHAHWSAYFLNLQKIVDTCWDAGTIVGCGRGSGVGFLLLHLLDIVQINCLEETTKLFPWRFLNPDRVSVLDVDIDISGLKRAKVLKAFRERYGEDRVSNVATFGTEKSKSAILTACRGLGIDNDIASYLASLIPSDRGQVRTLAQTFYGDPENDIKPTTTFVNEMTNNYPEVWAIAQKIEGLICRMGIHAGGVIFVDEDFSESTALMRAPDGTLITQFELHDCEDVSLIKYDLLSVEAIDRMQICLELLIKNGEVENKPTFKETYESVIGISNLEKTSPEMWRMIWEHKIISLFQMEQQSGIQGIALVKPENVDDLAVLNSIIRLQAQDKDSELPLNKFARYKKNINLWYKEMGEYGLTKAEQKVLEPIVKQSYGICESQEKFMQLVQLPECGGFSLGFADQLRKSIAKKNPKAYKELEKEYFEKTAEKGCSKALCAYVWNVLIAMSRGYGFRQN